MKQIDRSRNTSEGQARCERPGVDISALKRGSELTVRTRNSTYAMVVLSPLDQKVLIRGGHHFRPSTEATLLGSSSLEEVQAGRIATRASLDILANGRRYVTSPIEAIECDSQSGSATTPVSPRGPRGPRGNAESMALQQLFQLVAEGRVNEDGKTIWICPLGHCGRRIETSSDAELRDRMAIEHSLSHVHAAGSKSSSGRGVKFARAV